MSNSELVLLLGPWGCFSSRIGDSVEDLGWALLFQPVASLVAVRSHVYFSSWQDWGPESCDFYINDLTSLFSSVKGGNLPIMYVLRTLRLQDDGRLIGNLNFLSLLWVFWMG